MKADNTDDSNYLVRVRAQVMTRDDSKGGWVPMGGGGLSNVSVRKRAVLSEETKYEYLIYGKRISDQSVVLSCTIKKDFQYNRVMPTFHHWKTGDKKFGLTFQTAADARAFDKGVRQAVEDLLDGLPDSSSNQDVGEDDVFMTLELPVERGDSRSSSGSSTNGGSGGFGCPSSTTPSLSVEPFTGSPYTHPHSNHHHLHKITYISRPQRTTNGGNGSNGQNGGNGERRTKEQQEDVWVRNEEKPFGKKDDSDKIEIGQGESYSYVQFARAGQRLGGSGGQHVSDFPDRPSPHEYSYPIVDAISNVKRHDSLTNIKKHSFEVKPTLLPTKTKKKKGRKKDKHKHLITDRARCRHCHEMFAEEDNERGSCEYAPDRIRTCINAVTCISCAQCMMYHCMSDAEGDFAHHPCSCDVSDDHCGKRWIGLAVLSFFVPCLWCYLPLRACHKCGISCGFCGGRHESS